MVETNTLTLPTRRGFLLGVSGAAIVAAMPGAPASAAASPTPAAPLPTWIVGTPGESDYEVVRATDSEAAIRFRAEEWSNLTTCAPGCESPQGGDCDFCRALSRFDAERVKRWDGRDIDSITSADWLDQGFGHTCDRCGEETDGDDGQAVNGEAVCGDCMTLADWDIIDPEYAAELRAEQEDDDPALPLSLAGEA